MNLKDIAKEVKEELGIEISNTNAKKLVEGVMKKAFEYATDGTRVAVPGLLSITRKVDDRRSVVVAGKEYRRDGKIVTPIIKASDSFKKTIPFD